ncbi:MAG: GNAT family N-acetyltransferase, partial [Bacteroidota bacterium]
MKPTDIDDAAFIFELFNEPKWIKYIGNRNIASVEQAKDYIVERMTPQLQRLGYSSYTLIKKDDQQKIGVCGLYDREGLDGIDLG